MTVVYKEMSREDYRKAAALFGKIVVSVLLTDLCLRGIKSWSLRCRMKELAKRPSADDPSCASSLLSSDGQFDNSGNWVPTGCRMHEYSSSDVLKCSQGLEMATGHQLVLGFTGDSTIRELVNATHSLMGGAGYGNWHKHKPMSLVYPSQGLRLEFVWNPWLANKTLFANTVAIGPVSLMVVGGGVWFTANLDKSRTIPETFQAIAHLEASVLHLAHVIKTQFPDTDVLWAANHKLNPDGAIIPLETLEYYNTEFAQNAVIWAERTFRGHNVRIWSSTRGMIEAWEQKGLTPFTDMIHMDHDFVTRHRMQVLWNYLCNAVMDFQDNDKLCCLNRRLSQIPAPNR